MRYRVWTNYKRDSERALEAFFNSLEAAHDWISKVELEVSNETLFIIYEIKEVEVYRCLSKT